MSVHETPNTPNISTSTEKSELSSPEFSVDIKKNKPSSLSSESELEISDLFDTSALPPIIEMASSDTSASISSSNIVIPPSELAEIAEMLKDTFRGEIVNSVDSVVQGVLKGLNDRIVSLELGMRHWRVRIKPCCHVLLYWRRLRTRRSNTVGEITFVFRVVRSWVMKTPTILF